MDRFDELLDIALETGEVPGEASEAEREEILAMLAAAGVLREAADQTEAESAASLPMARARFERFVAASRPSVAVPPARPVQPSLPWWRRRLGPRLPNAIVAAGGLAAALVVVLFTVRALTTGAETVQALSPGEYVQLQGTVTSVEERDGVRQLTVDSELGRGLKVRVDQAAALESGVDLTRGSTILFSGTVDDQRQVVAGAVSLSSGTVTLPRVTKLKELRELLPDLQGTISMLTISPDGKRGRVLLTAADGERYLVTVDAASIGRLLELTQTLGARVSVAGPALGGGDFSLEPQAGNGTQKPGFQRLIGVLGAREGSNLTIDVRGTARTVRLRPATRIVITDPSLTRPDVDAGSAVGHNVVVSGVIDSKTGVLVADVILVGRKR